MNKIGETGFEPATARPPAECATRLRHSPWVLRILTDSGKLSRRRGSLLEAARARGGSSTVEPQPSKLMMRVRFPSAALSPLRALQIGSAVPIPARSMRAGFAQRSLSPARRRARRHRLAGCGGGSDGDSGSGASGGARSSTGRCSAACPSAPTTCPTKRATLDPPLREAWSINTHALIEFPPAVADGVAYVVNKYGNAQGGARCATARSSGNGSPTRSNSRQADRRHRARLPPGAASSSPSSTATWSRSTRRPASRPGSATCTPTSNPRRWRSAARSTSARQDQPRRRCAPPTARSSGSSTRPARSKPAPATTTAASTSPTTRAAMFCARRRQRQAALAHQHDARCRRSARAASTPRPRSPSAASTPPATTAPSSPSTKRPARSTGPSRPTTSSTARPPSPRCPARRRPSTSAPTTSTSTRSTRCSGKQRWSYDVGGPVPGTATVIGHTVYTSSFKTRETIGIDVRTHTQDLLAATRPATRRSSPTAAAST